MANLDQKVASGVQLSSLSHCDCHKAVLIGNVDIELGGAMQCATCLAWFCNDCAFSGSGGGFDFQSRYICAKEECYTEE